jgi:hypothetical protein
MDERINLIATKDGPLCFIEIARLKNERLKVEAMPEPEKVNLFQNEIAEMEKALQAECSQVVANIVDQAAQNILSVFSPENLFDEAKKVYRKEAVKLAAPDLMLRHLNEFKNSLQNHVYSRNLGVWNNRLKEIDANIKSWTAKIPAPFSEDKINKDVRFPISRCGQVDGKFYDKWLTDYLKSKPILFDSPQYTDKLVEFYQTVYLPEYKKEQADANKQALAQEQANEAARLEQMKNIVRQQDLHDPAGLWEDSALRQAERFGR